MKLDGWHVFCAAFQLGAVAYGIAEGAGIVAGWAAFMFLISMYWAFRFAEESNG